MLRAAFRVQGLKILALRLGGAQELQAQVRMATEQQVAAQRELHETRLQHRATPVQNGARSFNPDDAEGVHSIIEGLEQAGIGKEPRPCDRLWYGCWSLLCPALAGIVVLPGCCGNEPKQPQNIGL